MVVNRKQPTAPQSVSRSASTQHVPTKRTHPTKGTSKLNGVDGIDSRSTKPTVPTSKKTHAKKRRPKTFVDRLFLLSLSLFTFYAFYTCRPNPIFSTPLHSQSIEPNPLCRSLHGYRVHVLEPYVIPSVKHTLSFTHQLAEPYIAATQRKVDPYVAPVVKGANTVKPYVIHAVNTSKAIWKNAIVPFYKSTILRYYRIAVLPRYRLYIKPRLVPLAARASKAYGYYVSRPLHIQATRVNNALRTHLHPYIVRVQPYINQAYATVYDLIAQTITAYQTHVHPRLVAAWIAARPHLCTALKVSKVAGLKTAEIATTQAKFAAREAGAYRRTYVDPHVRKIWDKVAEGTPSASVPGSTPTTITTPPLAADLPELTSETVESVLTPTSITAEEELASTPIPVTPEVVVEDTRVAEPTIPNPEEAVESEVPTGAKTSIPPPVDAYDEPAVESTAPKVEHQVPVEVPAPEAIPEPTPAESITAEEPITPAPVPTASAKAMHSAKSIEVASILGSEPADDLDLDAFLADLGVEAEKAAPTTAQADADTAPTTSLSVSQAEPSQLEEERLAVIAAKRDAIVDRHEKWFADLDALVGNETEALIDTLIDWRMAKVTELSVLAAGNGSGVPLVDEVQTAGERLLKGLDGYVRKAEARAAAWKFSPDASKEEKETKAALSKAEKEKWGTVVSKVEAKFSDTVQALRAKVHEWFVEERAYEAEAVTTSALRVKALAERAQADLGLSYAWLEDVTYEDWQGYHDLMRIFQTYEDTARALQNGTELAEPAPLPPADPIVPALDALHNELQDVILGFNVALGPVRSAAARVFSVHIVAEDAEDEDSGFFVVRDGEVRRDDLRGVDLGALKIEKKAGAGTVGVKGQAEEDKKVKVEEDEVRILPIGPGPGDAGEALDPSAIFIGKDRVQVEQALGGVPLEPAAARHEEL